jgi:hypothetical protein
MNPPTIIERIINWYWWSMARIANHTLKHFGYDFGPYFMEELEKMYRANAFSINRNP